MSTVDPETSVDLKRYLALGYRVHPICPGQKTPLLPGWPDKATNDTATLREWARQYPGCNWAIVTGEGFSVLDIDPAALKAGWPGEERRRELKATGCPLVQTPRGGFHLYFRAGWPNSTGRVASGVDTKGSRGYVLVPPSSVHAQPYVWIRPLVTIDELPAPPVWLEAEVVELNAQAPGRLRSPESAQSNVSEDLEALLEGTRNIGLTRLAGRLRRLGLSQAELESALLAANSFRCRPPLPEREVLAIARSVSRYPPAIACATFSRSVAMQRAWRASLRVHSKPRKEGKT
ncbi:bifunctional DNA primase/polymerase [Thermogutta sp.]|uniref:bifunctional DNA primase/polymerase n=1 Tax=Thermogutta sp. TaxID=1962930 RepID=UPI00322091C4